MNPKDINPTRVNSRAYPVAYPIAYPWLEIAIPAGVGLELEIAIPAGVLWLRAGNRNSSTRNTQGIQHKEYTRNTAQ